MEVGVREPRQHAAPAQVNDAGTRAEGGSGFLRAADGQAPHVTHGNGAGAGTVRIHGVDIAIEKKDFRMHGRYRACSYTRYLRYGFPPSFNAVLVMATLSSSTQDISAA